MKEFIDYLLRFGNLNQHQIELIADKGKELDLQKDDYFAEAGKVLKQVGFIVEGVLRISYFNNKGEEITKYFLDENHLIFKLKEEPFTEYIQAATHCKLVVFSNKDWKEISETIVGWDAIFQKIITKTLSEKLERRSPLIEKSALQRYLMFMEVFPTLTNRIQLSYIASYLGITQSSLSRIRKNIR